jgi:hypothetical protein
MSILAPSMPLAAQGAHDPNPALRQATIDEAALGTPGRAFAEYSTGSDIDWIAATGIGFGGGMLRVSYGEGFTQRIYGLGFARPIAQRNLGMFGTLTSGVDLSGAFDDNTAYFYKSRAARLALPLSWRLGSPSRFSMTPYVAPYAEIGRALIFHADCGTGVPCTPAAFFPDQTRSLGLGGGVDITAWKLGFNIGMTGVPTRLNLYRNGAWNTNASVRIRF